MRENSTRGTKLAALAIASLALGCSGTGQDELEYAAFAVPAPAGAIDADGWEITLDEASFAFGPIYFCASATGSATLCEAAIAEITAVARVDALVPAPQPIGLVHGLAGEIRSASYDYGLHWFLTEPAPAADPAAPGGHSARFVGRAVNGTNDLRFEADVDVIAQYRGQRAVPSAPASATIDDDAVRLEVAFDPGAWIAAVDFDQLLAKGDGVRRIEPGTKAHDAIVIAMVAGRPATFTWAATEAP